MATIPIQVLEVAGTISGNAPAVLNLPEGATQTFATGAILTLTAGYVVEAGADPARVLGVSCGPGQNLATDGLKDCLFYEANDDTVFIANFAGAATAITIVGFAYSVVKQTTPPIWSVDGADIANRIAIIRKLDSRDAVGDTNGRVHFIFHPSRSVLHYTS